MQVNPKPQVVKKLKEIAQKQGISLNALLVPYLNEIADGTLARRACYLPPAERQRVT